MIRPYLAILSDSFHAALASRVLWIALLAIWILLGALSPIGFREDFTTKFHWSDFENGTKLKAMLAIGLVNPEEASEPVARIAESLPEDLTRQLRQVGEGNEVRIFQSSLADGLNELLDQEDWYDEQAWSSLLRLRELRDLDDTADDLLTESTRRRRARLRLEAALPGVLVARSSRSTVITYAGYDFPGTLPIDKAQFKLIVNQLVLPEIIKWLLGFILVFLGILVTSSLIPDLLQPGSLHLLLSKPISRVMLFLTKFVGGCSFVFLCVSQLIVGLWLIAGFRLDLWNIRLLWCIPVCVFLFAVFFSVSVLAGLRWRSPIISIGVTCMFGALVFVAGFIGGLFDGLVQRPAKIASITVADETIFAATRGEGLLRFDPEQNVWEEIIESKAIPRDRVLKPVTLPNGHVVTALAKNGRANAFGLGTLDLILLSKDQGWEQERSIPLPVATTRLFTSQNGDLIVKNTGDLFVANQSKIRSIESSDDPSEESTNETDPPQPAGFLGRLFDLQGSGTEDFSSLLPPRVNVVNPNDIILSPSGNDLWMISLGRLVHLRQPMDQTNANSSPQPWKLVADITVEGQQTAIPKLALSGSQIMVIRSEEPMRFFHAENLENLNSPAEIDEDQKGSSPIALQVIGLPTLDNEARFAVMYADGTAKLLSNNQVDGTLVTTTEPFPISELEAIYFDSKTNNLYAAHHVDRIDVFDGTTLQSIATYRPSIASWRLVNKYVISPLRTVIPQTGELGGTVAAIISGTTTIQVPNGTEQGDVVRHRILRPVLSCAGFIFVMLSIGCVYFARSDF